MPVSPDVSVFGKNQGFSDYQRANEEFALRKALAQAGLNKAMRGDNLPSSVQEYNAFKNLTPEEQRQYLLVKRASPYLNLGQQFVQPDPVTGNVNNSFPISPPPEQMPDFKGDQEKAKAIGDAAGKAQGATEKKYIQAPELERQLKLAEELLPKATSGGLNTLTRDTAAFFNSATPESEIDSQLNVIGAALTSQVPRMEGPQSNFDVKLYEKAAGDLANSALPTPTRLSAIRTMRNLNNKYLRSNAEPNANIMSEIDQNAAINDIFGEAQPVVLSTDKPQLKESDIAQSLMNAKKAIAAGKPRDAVIKKLQDAGIDPAKAGL